MYPSGQSIDSSREISSFVSVSATFMLFFSPFVFFVLSLFFSFLPYFSLNQRIDSTVSVVCLNCMLVLWCYKFLFWISALILNYIIGIMQILNSGLELKKKNAIQSWWNLGSEPQWSVWVFFCASKSVVFVCSSVFSFLSSWFPVSQPCHDDPDKEQRIKELELLLMSAENEVRRQSGPRVRTTVCAHRVVRLGFPTASIPPLFPFFPLITSALGDPSLPSLLLHLIVACCQ